MKKTICTAALAAVISFGTVYAVPAHRDANTITQQDTVKKKVKVKDDKKKMKTKKDSAGVTKKTKVKMKKDTV
ncbi:hypothetical protein [Mucilaginibacter myungsuensis]|uniref:Pentapeptide MXKDX repeat protein n=1 Tax=Mucilaginibacter myungsuensis TaxID=649104 RepID=A0A929KW66_9SPHI|nr:hypothetical protein [Mucilaginibacter myungsuensis]MBE9661028.1 hypothetical protein [Mucilaginibacter myungsuensis]MDN3597172.1 hypothetical protein [Mucilaginibacter myungsuensis]